MIVNFRLNKGEYVVHNYILVDIVEVYDNSKVDVIYGLIREPKLVGHNYVIGCYSCGKVRVINESTFNLMVKLGLIEEQEEN